MPLRFSDSVFWGKPGNTGKDGLWVEMFNNSPQGCATTNQPEVTTTSSSSFSFITLAEPYIGITRRRQRVGHGGTWPPNFW